MAAEPSRRTVAKADVGAVRRPAQGGDGPGGRGDDGVRSVLGGDGDVVLVGAVGPDDDDPGRFGRSGLVDIGDARAVRCPGGEAVAVAGDEEAASGAVRVRYPQAGAAGVDAR